MTRETRTERARDLRQRMTRAEKALWQAVRGGRLEGLKFRRQFPIGPYFADFACEKACLAVELDGAAHDGDDQVTRDYFRQQEIEALGWCVLRFRNEEVFEDLGKVLDVVRAQVKLASSVTPHPPAQQS